jgi:hypothetical protein
MPRASPRRTRLLDAAARGRIGRRSGAAALIDSPSMGEMLAMTEDGIAAFPAARA